MVKKKGAKPQLQQLIQHYTKYSISWIFHLFRTLDHLTGCCVSSLSGLMLIKNPYPTQFPSLHSYGIFVFHSRPWCQQVIEFSPSSSRVKDLTWMRQEKTELYFLSTPAASAQRALTGGKNISGTPNFIFLKGFGPPVLSHQLLFKERCETKLFPKACRALPAPLGRAASLTIHSVETEKYLQLLPRWRKHRQNSARTEEMSQASTTRVSISNDEFIQLFF